MQNPDRKETDMNSSMMANALEAMKQKLVDGRLDYSSDKYWYQTGRDYDESKTDVFYCLSTTLLSSKDESGNPSLYSTLSEEDRKIMAGEEDDLGVIVSYNSVASADKMWDAIEGHSAACINPLNWKTDDTPATLHYDGDEASVHIDKEKQVLVVEGLDPEKYDGMGYPIDKGVYHMWDPRFYANEIRANAIHRAELFNRQ